MTPCLIRSATPQDAAAAIAVLRDSIIQLCVEDHQNDQATLQRWLRNKTEENFRRWVANPETVVVVAEMNSSVCGVGAMRISGDLDLCYVLPGRQRSGVGRALLRALEDQAAKCGLREVRLISTVTARQFYASHGYRFVGEEAVPGYGLLRDYHYVKQLT